MFFSTYISMILFKDLKVGIEINGQKKRYFGLRWWRCPSSRNGIRFADLQVLLDELNLWCIIHKMEIIPDKSKSVRFRNPSISRTSMVYTCGGKFLETVDKYVYLGLLLKQHLDYSLMAKQVADSANRALGLLISKCKSAGGLPFSTFTKL